MSAPSPCHVTQTPQREFALQNYRKFFKFANKSEKITYKFAYVQFLL